jgi:hypothetical protein
MSGQPKGVPDRYRDHLQANPPRFVEDKFEKLDHDFGFTAVDVTQHQNKIDKLEGLSRMFDSLLDALIGDPEKDYLYWPNRKQKITEWKAKIEAYLNDKESNGKS